MSTAGSVSGKGRKHRSTPRRCPTRLPREAWRPLPCSPTSAPEVRGRHAAAPARAAIRPPGRAAIPADAGQLDDRGGGTLASAPVGCIRICWRRQCCTQTKRRCRCSGSRAGRHRRRRTCGCTVRAGTDRQLSCMSTRPQGVVSILETSWPDSTAIYTSTVTRATTRWPGSHWSAVGARPPQVRRGTQGVAG